MKPFVFAVLLTSSFASLAHADVILFGSGGNQFAMEFAPIGNPNNPADATGSPNPAGSVPYNYKMGKHEVSRDMITKANAAGSLGITLDDMSSFGGNGADRPATGVSWNEAARFVNWLNTSQGYSPAYKFTTQPGGGGYNANQDISLWVSGDAGFNAANPFRNSQARYFLPSADEWYKAAYYNPGTGTYFDYPTGGNSAPTAVASGTTPGTAVYMKSSPADVTQAGGLSPYGVMGQGGNVWEFEETEFDLVNNSPAGGRGFRGGAFTDGNIEMLASSRSQFGTNVGIPFVGFRVASVPESSPVLLGSVIVLAAACWRWLTA
jgi:formylglycine-generating enzyme required for sulfatase activity